MTERGTVVGIDKHIITLNCAEEAKCKSCSSSFCAVKGKTVTAINRRNIPVQLGDTVEVVLPAGKTIFAGFMVLIFPLILFALFYLGGEILLGLTSDGPKVLAGLAGMILGFAFTYFSGKRRKENDYPEVCGLIQEEQGVMDELTRNC